MTDRHDRADGPRVVQGRPRRRASGGVIRTEVHDAPVVESSTASRGVDGPRGAELDEALEKANLPKTGSADEKRARLAEYQAQQEGETESE